VAFILTCYADLGPISIHEEHLFGKL